MEETLQRITAVEHRTKSNAHRIDKLEVALETMTELTVSIREIALETKYTREDVNDVVGRIKELENQPKNRWNDMVKTIITVIVTSLTMFLLTRLGIN